MTGDVTEILLELVPVYGAGAVFVVTFLSCLALPVPSSLAMLAAGAFAAVGDLSLAAVTGAAFSGAVLGDQAGYGLGRAGGPMLARRLARPATQRLRAQAEARLRARGLVTVFLTRWLAAPLGPYVNLAAGMARMAWWRFTSGSVTGEAVWVALYVGLGWGFAAQIDQIAAYAGAASGAIAAAAIAALGLTSLLRLSRHK